MTHGTIPTPSHAQDISNIGRQIPQKAHMQTATSLTPEELSDFLLNVATVRPVFIWGPPGIGKSALVEKFAASVGLDCVSLLGSQLAPEDLIGVPQITDGITRFRPPAMIAAKNRTACFWMSSTPAHRTSRRRSTVSFTTVVSASTSYLRDPSSSGPVTGRRTRPSSNPCRRRF